MGTDLDPEHLLVQLHELAPDGVGRRRVLVDPCEEPLLRPGSEIEVAGDHRARNLHRVPLRHPGHHRGEVPGPLRYPVGIDAAVEQSIVVGQPARPFQVWPPLVDSSLPPDPGEGVGLAGQLLGREQPPRPGVPERDSPRRVRVLDRIRTEPRGENHFHQEVLEVVRRSAVEAAPEAVGEALHLRPLGVGGEQQSFEICVLLILGRRRHLAPVMAGHQNLTVASAKRSSAAICFANHCTPLSGFGANSPAKPGSRMSRYQVSPSW